MFKFILSRLIQSIVVIFTILTLTFFMGRLAPGGPFSAEKRMPKYILEQVNAYYGLDKPMVVQYWNYLRGALPKKFAPGELSDGFDIKAAFGIDLGPSFTETRTVNEIIAGTFPTSFQLGFWAMLVALGIGLPVGILAAVRRNTLMDYLPMSAAMVGICLPTFVMGPVLALVFGVWLRWFSVAGWYTPQDRVLPALTLGLVYAAYMARIARGGMLEILSQDFIRTAQAKGVSGTAVIFKHALKGGMLPVISFLGPAMAAIISGSFVVETIFQIPGMGREFIESAFNRDYFLIQGTVLVYASLIVIANLGVDVVQVLINPRLRFEN